MSNIISSSEFTREQIELIKRTVAQNTSDSELAMFLHVARKYNLDPLLKEIWCIKYNSNAPVSIFTSRDGYLKIAHASGQLDGINSYTIDDEHGNPVKAVCEVWRKDMSRPFRAEVKFKEYFNSSNQTWRKYPSAMLIKVAEVFALRRAFSISGLATMEEAGAPEPPEQSTQPQPQPRPSYKMSDEEREAVLAIVNRFHLKRRKKALALIDLLTENQVKRLLNNPPFIDENQAKEIENLASQKGMTLEELESYLLQTYDIASVSDITTDIYDDVINYIASISDEP